MIISISPRGIVDIDRPGQGVIDISKSGFCNTVLDFSLACDSKAILKRSSGRVSAGRMKVINNTNTMGESIAVMLSKCNKNKIRLLTAYAPYLERQTNAKEDNSLYIDLVKESIRVAGEASIRQIVVRPVFAGIETDMLWEENRKFYLSLAELAAQYHVKILLENQCRYFNGHMLRGICSDKEEAIRWVDSLNILAGQELFGFCLNVGVCNLCGQNMYDFIKQLGNRINVVIISDGDGNKENYMLPFTAVNEGGNRTDWLKLVRGLREISYDGELILDIKDTAAATSPMLRLSMLKYAKSIADYFVWQIGIEKNLKKYPKRVLFGAGNMCRNYMKCYGELYPPEFTCDNNSNIWNTEFCGLQVKNPESLKTLSPDTAIFICNIYYREIEQQLRNMGIINPIKYFNDEYMPTFYFDRLEGDGRK